jgi:beta-ureidopropionase / N-carbamoyl-L-amino-acid hydrolase
MKTFTSTINSDRLNLSINKLAKIGQLSNGGVKRIAYSSEDILARQLIQKWMIEAGMTVRIDAGGNIIGTYAGLIGAPALVTGSHIDTVPSGGRYDGTLGVLAGIEVARVLRENSIQLAHPFEVIVFTDEETSMIGCKAIAGTYIQDPEFYRRRDGTSIQTCLEAVGGNWDKLATAKRSKADLAAFVELHVEQGGVLETIGKEIGVVQGIVSQTRYAIAITGRPNHAGTTPMNMRRDALVAAAQIVLAVNHLATETPGDQVATVGSLNVWPNAANIVPAKVDTTLDIRDLSLSHVDNLVEQLQQQIQAIAKATQTEITITPTLRVEGAPAAPHIQEKIVQACQQIGLTYDHLPSRASHDAQEMGKITDMGMIFVPSREGISHSEEEYTSPEQCTQGTEVLLSTLLQLDKF